MEQERFSRLMKLLVEPNPQAIVRFLLKNAIYEGELDRELALKMYKQSKLTPEMEERIRNADELYHVVWNDERIILHLEFQRIGEQDVPRKIWECNALTAIVTDQLVYSVVIYGLPEPPIPEPIYQIKWPNGQVTQSFTFQLVKLWEVEPEKIEDPTFTGLLPLLRLTKNGQNSETLEHMLRDIESA